MISVIMPVYNQGLKARGAFLKARDILGKFKDKYEVIFIDDGSADDTFRILRDIYINYSNVKVIRLERHAGQHQALFAGFELACGDIIMTMDADAKVNPEYIPDLLNKLKEGHDLVVAWRVKRPGLGLFRRWGSFLINAYTNFITGQKLHDHACSLKAFSGGLIRNNINRSDLRRFFAIKVARYAKRAAEIKVACPFKPDYEASLSPLKLIILALDLLTSRLRGMKNYRGFKIAEVLAK